MFYFYNSVEKLSILAFGPRSKPYLAGVAAFSLIGIGFVILRAAFTPELSVQIHREAVAGARKLKGESIEILIAKIVFVIEIFPQLFLQISTDQTLRIFEDEE